MHWCSGSTRCEALAHRSDCPMLTVSDTPIDRPDHDSDHCFAPGGQVRDTRGQIRDDLKHDAVEHPSHYADRVPGIECIEVAQHFNFNRGNAIKYLWRAGAKGDEIEDLRKARQYIGFEIARLGGNP